MATGAMWIVVGIDDYSFVDETSGIATLGTGQDLQSKISGVYVSGSGVDWEICPIDDTNSMNTGSIEGGFPKSEDYACWTLYPPNTSIRPGLISDDWVNGMLAWKIRA